MERGFRRSEGHLGKPGQAGPVNASHFFPANCFLPTIWLSTTQKTI